LRERLERLIEDMIRVEQWDEQAMLTAEDQGNAGEVAWRKGRISANREWRIKLQGLLEEGEPNLKKYHDRYEEIMEMKPGWERDRELAELMTELEQWVPLFRDPEWEKRNRPLIALYRKISQSRTFGEE